MHPLKLVFIFLGLGNISGWAQTLEFSSSPTSDSLLRIEFTEYLDHILSQSKDSILTIDRADIYTYRFVSSCPYHQGVSTDDFLDEFYNLICIRNIQQASDIVQLISNPDISVSDRNAFLKDSSRTKLPVLSLPFHLKSLAQSREFPHYSFFSFGNGMYLIIQEVMIT